MVKAWREVEIAIARMIEECANLIGLLVQHLAIDLLNSLK
jgi:hypothetical protein